MRRPLTAENICLGRRSLYGVTVGISTAAGIKTTQLLVPVALNFRQITSPKSLKAAKKCGAFMQWGAKETDQMGMIRSFAAELRRPHFYVEDGFLRSFDIGLSGEPGISVILDDLGFYFDARRPSRLETILNTEHIGSLRRWRARRAIGKIVRNKVSKFNNAPECLPFELEERTTKKRILLVDQRAGDESIAGALADSGAFTKMLENAFQQEGVEVVVKIHPDAMSGKKQSAISETLQGWRNDSRLKLVATPVNPYTLFQAVDEVHAVGSGMGFEAAMAGKPVHCWGAPYYAGWGFTTDHITVPRRHRRRSIEEVFYAAWIMLSRYADPHTKRRCSVERAVKVLAHDPRRTTLSHDASFGEPESRLFTTAHVTPASTLARP